MTDKKDDAIYIRVSDDERKKIRKKMSQCGITNESAYIRKMAIDGVIVRLQISEITELLRLMRIYGNNVNQIAKAVNSSGYVTEKEVETIQNNQKEIWKILNTVLDKLMAVSG